MIKKKELDLEKQFKDIDEKERQLKEWEEKLILR